MFVDKRVNSAIMTTFLDDENVVFDCVSYDGRIVVPWGSGFVIASSTGDISYMGAREEGVKDVEQLAASCIFYI